MTLRARSIPGAHTLHVALMLAAFSFDSDSELRFVVGTFLAIALFIFAPGGPVSSNISIQGVSIVGEGLFSRRVIAFSNLGAVEVIGELILRRVRLYAVDGSTVIETDLRFDQCDELLRALAGHAQHRLAPPVRPRTAYAVDILSLALATIAAVLAAGHVRLLGLALGVAIATTWTLLGWSHVRSLRVALAAGRTPATLAVV